MTSFITTVNQRTRNQFRPRNAHKGTTSYQLRQYAEATLGGGSLRKVVKLPEGEDENEWLAVNMVDFYNHINLLYGSITEFCSPQSCPEMKATDEFEYLWQDNENFKRPTKMPAPTYIEHLMAWVQASIDNETVFPSRIGVPFPKGFSTMIKQVFKRMYRVYAHIYCTITLLFVNLGWRLISILASNIMFSSLMNMIWQAVKTFGDLWVIWLTVCLGQIRRLANDKAMIHIIILLAFGTSYLGSSGVMEGGEGGWRGLSRAIGW
ncbi:hypothetical protein DID88_005753 [Monilinia fructigena]|uniref:Mob1/phocein family protein n=1 Tax=Monilinia fructigena TaxID=38457 RepID=A0A395J1X0_9HELO|nr:hypothetical protein DID88_005753 [Monilinia fructigena]